MSTEETTPKKKKSTGYALKAVYSHLQTLVDGGLLDDTDKAKLWTIIGKARDKYVKEQYGTP